MDQIAKHIIFTGRVQGVGFRYTTYRIARGYDVAGFVRNLSDGTVEMLAQGPADEVDCCIQEVQDSFAGYIQDARIEQIPCNPRYSDFGIVH
ncbi:acylphosphatase [Anaerobaca lacustris]|uniref:acylphosphatase n=1 Tax=Anaerobaca lacustris TaxID=3044600 RepID=A0AAW6TWH8_9BACT|nr:acylphosphatase [Sedimentisphaerales bacterium M17dextr]